MNEPAVAARGAFDRFGEMLAVYEENARLREENRRLLAWQAESARLSVQNKALREMLNVPTAEHAPAWTTARVVADAGGPFVHTLLIDAGSERGVRKGMAAVTPQGLAGRVIGVGRRSARVLLITDFDSKIPVASSARATARFWPATTASSRRSASCRCSRASRVGDLVLTSGEGGAPAGRASWSGG
jgi:rod shape-determining protein MreC